MKMYKHYLALIISFLVNLGFAVAATIPFTTGFESDPTDGSAPTGFIEGNSSLWTVQDGTPISGSQSYTYSVSGGGTDNSMIQMSNAGGSVATASDFVFSTSVRWDGGTSASGSVGLGLLALADSSGSSGGGRYYALTTTSGVMNLYKGTDSKDSTDVANLVVGTVYTFTLSGTYSDSGVDSINDQLTLDFSISGDAVSRTLTWTDTSPITTNNHFGIRGAAGGTRNLTATIDDFVVIPEPSTLVLSGLVFIAGIVLRRKN